MDPAEFQALLVDDKTRLLRQLWKRLGISSELFGSQPYFEVDRVELGPLANGDSCVMVRITDPLKWDWQYLVFARTADGTWVFKGNIDMRRQNDAYDPPPHRMLRIGRHGPWLIVRYKAGGGTGFSLHEDKWYDLEGKSIREVLTYPAAGSECNLWPYGTDVSARMLATTPKPGGALVVIVFDIDRINTTDYNVPELKGLLSETRKVTFRWNPSRRLFEIDPAASDLTEDGIRNIIDYRSTELLGRHYAEFLKLAALERPPVQKWLGVFLEGCRDCKEKDGLRRAMDRSAK